MNQHRDIFQGWAISDKGRVRSRNEDDGDLFITPGTDAALAVVADGVGGHPGGDIASRLAVQRLLNEAEDGLPYYSLEHWLRRAVLAANARVRNEQRRDEAHAGMATTIAALLALGNRVAVAHLGDSRAYRLRGHRLTPLTVDHTVAQAMFEEGTYTREDLARSPYQHVLTRGLGLTDRPDCPARQYRSQPGDLYLLCSDGLNKVLPEETIRRILMQKPTPRDRADALVEAANDAGGPDNITVVVVERNSMTSED